MCTQSVLRGEMYAQLYILQDGVCDVIIIKEQVKCSKTPVKENLILTWT